MNDQLLKILKPNTHFPCIPLIILDVLGKSAEKD